MRDSNRKSTVHMEEEGRQNWRPFPVLVQGGGDAVPGPHPLLSTALRVHNGPAQQLAGVLAQFRVLQHEIPATLRRAHESLRASIASTQTALDATRDVIRLLRAPEQAGPAVTLVGRLHAAIEAVRPLTNAWLSVKADGVGRLPRAVEAGLAAVAHEALINAATHSAARHIAVAVRRANRTIVLEVEDDGKGLSLSKRAARRGHGGLGLALMREQARLLGGNLTIMRRPAGGTVVRAVIPAPRMWRSGPAPRPRRSARWHPTPGARSSPADGRTGAARFRVRGRGRSVRSRARGAGGAARGAERLL